MATYYWTKQTNNGTGNWSNVNMWASTTGGVGGTGAVPTVGDDARFDSNSFGAAGQTATIDSAGLLCRNMDWTGATNSPSLSGSNYLRIAGNLTLISAMTAVNLTGFDFYDTTTITTNGCSVINTTLRIFGGTISLADGLNIGSGAFYLYSGSATTNGNTVTCGDAYDLGSAVAHTLTLGGSIFNCADWLFTGTNMTLTANTSTINCSGDFSGASLTTYNIVNLTGTTCAISGSNTFAQFNLSSGTTQIITFTDTTTQTAASLTLSGSAGHVHTLQGSSTGSWNITYTGAGQLLMDYISVSYSTASPNNTFYDYTHGTNGGNNTYWYFNAPSGGGLSAIPLGFIHGR